MFYSVEAPQLNPKEAIGGVIRPPQRVAAAIRAGDNRMILELGPDPDFNTKSSNMNCFGIG